MHGEGNWLLVHATSHCLRISTVRGRPRAEREAIPKWCSTCTRTGGSEPNRGLEAGRPGGAGHRPVPDVDSARRSGRWRRNTVRKPSQSGPPSGGRGSGGGIGDGIGTGVGDSRGPGYRPGPGGGGVTGGGFGFVGAVTQPVLLWKIEPEYTDEARRAKIQGTVVLHIEVDTRGQAQNITVRQSLGLGLDERAIEAVRRWRFRPGYRNGEPWVTAAMVQVNFRLL